MMRRPVIAGNWKMHKTIAETEEFLNQFLPQIASVDYCDIVISPSFPSLVTASEKARDSQVAIAAQDVHWEESGAFTGEVSAKMLADSGCKHVIIGHSERRQYFGETDMTVSKKISAVLRVGLKPIICVGETLEERENGKAEDVVRSQVREALVQLTEQALSNIIIAYEPVWAIGTGRTASSDQAESMHNLIRKSVSEAFGVLEADGVRILYGGSVKPGNIAELMASENIDGALVGGASLDVASFTAIVCYKES